MFIYFVFFVISKAPGKRTYWNIMPPSEFVSTTGQINPVPTKQCGFDLIRQQGNFDNIMKICGLFVECLQLKLNFYLKFHINTQNEVRDFIINFRKSTYM